MHLPTDRGVPLEERHAVHARSRRLGRGPGFSGSGAFAAASGQRPSGSNCPSTPSAGASTISRGRSGHAVHARRPRRASDRRRRDGGLRGRTHGGCIVRSVARQHSAANALSGEVRVAVTEGLGTFWLAPRLVEFQQSFPNILVDLQCAMRSADVSRHEAEVAIDLVAPVLARRQAGQARRHASDVVCRPEISRQLRRAETGG